MSHTIPNCAPTFVMATDRRSIISLDGSTRFTKLRDPDRFSMLSYANGRVMIGSESVNLGSNLVAALIGWDRPCDLWSEQERQAFTDRIRDSDNGD